MRASLVKVTLTLTPRTSTGSIFFLIFMLISVALRYCGFWDLFLFFLFFWFFIIISANWEIVLLSGSFLFFLFFCILSVFV